jgi:hypothetical protein
LHMLLFGKYSFSYTCLSHKIELDSKSLLSFLAND